MLFVGQMLVSKDGALTYFTDHAEVLWQVPIAVALLAVYYAAIGVALASLTDRRIVGGVAIIGVAFVTTVVGGIVLWSFSNLRFQAEMAQLLTLLMIVNMLGAIIIVPTFYSILRPRVATALLSDEQKEAMRLHQERERKLGLHDQ